VQLKTKEFKDLRQSRNLSLSDIAKRLDLTPKAVYEYESSSMKTRLAISRRCPGSSSSASKNSLRQFSETIDVFVKLYKSNYETIRDLAGFQQEIDHRLTELGFITYWFNKAPIDMSFEEAAGDEAKEKGAQKDQAIAGPRNVFISEISSVKEAGPATSRERSRTRRRSWRNT